MDEERTTVAELVDRLTGTEEARETMKILLQSMAGDLSVEEACEPSRAKSMIARIWVGPRSLNGARVVRVGGRKMIERGGLRAIEALLRLIRSSTPVTSRRANRELGQDFDHRCR